ncbi:hypothetical protein Micbo1qcDRAFT_220986 [Microdochium bolleyi]|uniref:Uncharacterized protein n=1 Tax=Microdochium bolleyi TaxID=196109 RepID=A0A136JBA5_9PEZI|nr:hypothetical protein Micbo1qcDRAFT_220986 [Microdochium bolleyi]
MAESTQIYTEMGPSPEIPDTRLATGSPASLPRIHETMPGSFPADLDRLSILKAAQTAHARQIATREAHRQAKEVRFVIDKPQQQTHQVQTTEINQAEPTLHPSRSRSKSAGPEEKERELSQRSLRTGPLASFVLSRPQQWKAFGIKLCDVAALSLHAGLLLGYQVAAYKSDSSAMIILMLVLAVISGLCAMVVVLVVDAATRGRKRMVSLYPILGSFTGAMLWIPIGGAAPLQHRAVPDEQWFHWMVLCSWLGFLSEFVFCFWRMLFRDVLLQYQCIHRHDCIADQDEVEG